MLEKIQGMLAEALNISVDKVTADAKIVEDLGADSLDVVELLSQLEEEYGIVIPDEFVVGYGLDLDGQFRNFREVRIVR